MFFTFIIRVYYFVLISFHAVLISSDAEMLSDAEETQKRRKQVRGAEKKHFFLSKFRRADDSQGSFLQL